MNKECRTSWAIGFIIIVLFVLLGELSNALPGYFYKRLGANIDLIQSALWSMPFAAGFIAAYGGQKSRIMAALSYIIILPFAGTCGHLLNSALGTPLDFPGFNGAIWILLFYVFFGGTVVGAGILTALAVSTNREEE